MIKRMTLLTAALIGACCFAERAVAAPEPAKPAPPAAVIPQIPVVDSVEVETVVDNFYDAFQKEEKGAKRVLLANADSWEDVRLQAEMGLAYIIKVKVGKEEHVILYDFGLSQSVYENNLKHLKADLSKAEVLVLSHGHQDHYGGIYWASQQTKMPLYVGGEDAFAHRVFTPAGRQVEFGTLDRTALAKTSKIIIATQPTIIAGVALSTGEIPHVTAYEKVPLAFKMEKAGALIQDPITHEQALIFNVKGKGLVIVVACAHVGVVNTIEYAKRITKETRILAVLGGLHLTAATNDVIDKTIAAIKASGAQFIAPMHCTGQRAIARFQKEMPDAYIQQSVGTRYVFDASTKP